MAEGCTNDDPLGWRARVRSLFYVLIPYSSGNHPDPATFQKQLRIRDLQASFLYIKRDIPYLVFFCPIIMTNMAEYNLRQQSHYTRLAQHPKPKQ